MILTQACERSDRKDRSFGHAGRLGEDPAVATPIITYMVIPYLNITRKRPWWVGDSYLKKTGKISADISSTEGLVGSP